MILQLMSARPWREQQDEPKPSSAPAGLMLFTLISLAYLRTLSWENLAPPSVDGEHCKC